MAELQTLVQRTSLTQLPPLIVPSSPCADLTVPLKKIRLCTIDAGTKDGSIYCTLTEACLNESIGYKCLSYVWGPPEDTRTITVDGSAHAVTRGLHAALDRLQAAGMRAALWVDSLCINQRDDEDKQQQVALMGEIFEKADEVMVWLGDTPVLRRKLRALTGSQMAILMKLLADDTHFHDLPIRTHCEASRCPSRSGGTANGDYSWRDALAALMAWFDTTWFERAWTVQEIVLARKSTLILGDQTLSWEVVSTAWVNFGRHMRTCCTECVYSLPGQDSEKLYRMSSRVIDLVTAREKLYRGQHLVEPLLQFSWKKATNPRDKLYGLLGLQSGRKPTPVAPDYSISLEQLFTRFAADVIRTQGWLVPLCLDLRQELPGLASWVPDWSVSSLDPVVYRFLRFCWSYTYNAAKGFDGEAQISEDVMLLTEGLLVDRVVQIGQPYELKDNRSDRLRVLDSWKLLLCLESKGSEVYRTGGDLNEAFWRTMFADRYHENEQSRPLIFQDVRRFQKFLRKARKLLQEYGSDALVGLNEALTSHIIAVLDRRLIKTTGGFIGLAPSAVRIGDEIFVLRSCPVPVILRQLATKVDEYCVLGHCYIHGIMDGEAVELDLTPTRIAIR